MMKKIISLICVASISMSVSACSQGDPQSISEENQPSVQILFSDLEWGCSHESVIASIGSENASLAGDAYMAYPDSPFDYFPLAANAGNILAVSSLEVMGYDAISTLFFSYLLTDTETVDTSSDSLYLVRSQVIADDCTTAYQEICEKLTALYGDGTESSRTGQSLAVDSSGTSAFDREIFETSWSGAGSSFARIKLDIPNTKDESPTLFIAFGILDAADTLRIIEAS